MAYLFFNAEGVGGLSSISTDADKGSHRPDESYHAVKQVSDSDFESVRNGTKTAVLSGDNVSYNDEVVVYEAAAVLNMYFDNIMAAFNAFIDNNPEHSMITSVTEYRNFINTFDTNTLTYPMEKSWEKHCEDNSITYFHPLQLP
jgi:hypothetical protein